MDIMLNKDECVTVIDLINRCLEIKTIKDLSDYYNYIGLRLGVKKLIVVYFVNDLGSPEILSFGIDPDWQEFYLKEEYHYLDPVISLSLNSEIPVSWSDAFRHSSKELRSLIINEKDRRFQDGLSYGVVQHPITSRSIVVSMGGDIGGNKKALIKKILPHLADVCVRQSLWARPLFTPKEKEIIQWCAKGKSYGEIALINKISERTVKFHMKNIFEKLGAYNKPQAVAKSLSLGLI